MTEPLTTRTITLLEQIQWQGEFNDCPACKQGGTPPTHQHAHNCELATLLNDLRTIHPT